MAATYFSQFAAFTPNPSARFNAQLAALAQHQNWSKAEKKQRRGEAIEAEFHDLYGTDYGRLDKWQELCQDVGVDAVPSTVGGCKKALKTAMVNIVNLIDHKRTGAPLKQFGSYKEFRKYTMDGRTLAKEKAKRNAFLRVLLRVVV